MNRNKNIVTGVLALVVSVVAVGIAYSAFTGTLNINGTGNVVSSKWDIYFDNLSNAVTTGTANVVTPATISPKTKIGDYYVELATPGDSVTYTFDVVNDGNFDAKLTTLTKNNPTCTPSATLCNYLTYTLTYTSGGATVAQNDTLLSGETKNMTLKLMLRLDTPASALSSTELRVTGLGITLLYSQDSPYGGNPVAPTYLYTTEQHSLGDTLEVDNTTVFDNFENAKYNSQPMTTAHIVDNSNHIIESYVAFKINDTIYYLKGYDTSAYEDNQEVLIEAFGRAACSGLTVMNYTIKDTLLNILGIERVYAVPPEPTERPTNPSCSGGGLRADAYSNGRVFANSGEAYCDVFPGYGYSRCS